MKILENKRLFLGIMILFTLVNLAFVLTIVYKVDVQYKHRAYKHQESVKRDGKFMGREIGFNKDQQEQFNQVRLKFRKKVSPLHEQLRSLNTLLINEVTSAQPDTLKCSELSRQIGEVHAAVKLASFKHFLEVRSIATPSQVGKLNDFYSKLFLNRKSQDGFRSAPADSHPTRDRKRH